MVESYCVPFKVMNYFKALKERVIELDLIGFIAIIKRVQDRRRFSSSYINHYKPVTSAICTRVSKLKFQDDMRIQKIKQYYF